MSDTKALTITKHLKVNLTDGRRLHLACEQAEQRHEERKHAQYLENIKKAMQSKIKEAQNRQDIAAEAIHQGFEMCEISCEQKIEGSHMVTYRLDTGEKIDERALTADEQREQRKARP